MKKYILPTIIALLSFPLGGLAGSNNIDESKSLAPTPKPSALSGDMGISALNIYNSRGIIVENKGCVLQPYGDLFYNICKSDSFAFSLQAGIWNDINTAGPLARPGSGVKPWTEFDWDTGFILKFNQRFSLSTVYLQYFSPSDAYKLGRFINNTLTFDDAGLLDKNFSIQPHLTVLYELPAPGQAGLRPHSWYFEPGISPNYTFLKQSKTPVNLGLPLYSGLGSGFYAGTTYGYFAVGPQVTVTLGCIPPQYGAWNFSAGYRYYNLGTTTTSVAPAHNSNQNIFNASVGLSF